MKNANLWIKYMSVNALALGVLMAAFGIYNSWSEHAMTPEAPLLNITLGLICFTYFVRAFKHPNREKVLFTVRGMEYRQGNSNLVTWGLFFGVLVFAVTHPAKWVRDFHLFFTGAAIISAYVEVVFYYIREKGPMFWGSVLSLFAGTFGFLLGFVFKIYSVSIAEVLAALPIVIHILVTNKKSLWKKH